MHFAARMTARWSSQESHCRYVSLSLRVSLQKFVLFKDFHYRYLYRGFHSRFVSQDCHCMNVFCSKGLNTNYMCKRCHCIYLLSWLSLQIYLSDASMGRRGVCTAHCILDSQSGAIQNWPSFEALLMGFETSISRLLVQHSTHLSTTPD